MNWQDAADRIEWNVQPFIDGKYVASQGAEVFDKINPANERVLYCAAIGTPADVDGAVLTARRRFSEGSWAELTIDRRAEILSRLADKVAQHAATLALLDTMEMGKPIRVSLDEAELECPKLVRKWAGLADQLLGATSPLSRNGLMFSTYEPRGVVGAITPWNFPLINAVTKVAPALLAGNSVILKPSEVAPSSALKLAELAVEAGVPSGVLNVVPGLGRLVGAALARHHDVDLISFTGSVATGRKIIEHSGQSNGKPMTLECGGKSPNIVFADLHDVDVVARAVVHGVLWNQGQVCSAHTRLLVQKEMKSILLDKIVSLVRKVRAGDPLDEGTAYGPLASPQQRERVRRYIEGALKEGAEIVVRGEIEERGCYVAPTVFGQVTGAMAVAREEIFGPVLCVQEFSTDDDGIEMANDTPYGLVATVWTRDLDRANRLARGIKAGLIFVRAAGSESADTGFALGFEPRKFSGFGTESGIRGLEAYSALKLVNFTGGLSVMVAEGRGSEARGEY